MWRPEGRGRREGAALVMVIWVLTALGVMLSEYIRASRGLLDAARNQKTEAVAYYLARGAFQKALDEIRRDYTYLLPGGDGGIFFVRPGEEAPEDLSVTRREGAVAGVGKYAFQISDEESKMNINRAERRQLVSFFRSSGMEMGAERDTLVDSILDWRDADKLHRLNGAEDDYYRSLKPPYFAKNADFDTVEELLLVKGLDPKLFYGSNGEKGRSLRDGLTVYGLTLNYNTAPQEVLSAFLGPEADRIIAARLARPYRGSEGQSWFFTVAAEGRVEGSDFTRRLRAVVEKRRVISGKRAEVHVIRWIDVDPPEGLNPLG